MNEILSNIVKAAEANAKYSDGDYIENGLLMCGFCRTQKETWFEVPGLVPHRKVVCMCKCSEENYRNGVSEQKAKEKREKLRRECTTDMDTASAREMTLDKDDGANPTITHLAKSFVDNFDELSKDGNGLVLWGNPGTGKTFFATAIGNELLKRGKTVARVSAAKVVENAQGLYDYERSSFVSLLNRNDLLILDDIGAERDTDFAREVMFRLVDERTRRKGMTIVTTNLTNDFMQNPTKNGYPDMGYKRVFDRLMSYCTPVLVAGESRRKKQGAEAFARLREVV